MSVLCLNRTQAVRLGCTVGGLEHEIVDELAPFFVDLAAVRRDARLLVRQIGDERFLHPEHGVGVEIGAFGREDMGGQAFEAFLSDHEVNMRGTIGELGRASSRERVGQYVEIWLVAASFKKKQYEIQRER